MRLLTHKLEYLHIPVVFSTSVSVTDEDSARLSDDRSISYRRSHLADLEVWAESILISTSGGQVLAAAARPASMHI